MPVLLIPVSLTLVGLSLAGLCLGLFLKIRELKKRAEQSDLALMDLQGELTARSAALQTECGNRVRIESKLRQLEARLERALEFSGVATWTWNQLENKVVWSGPVQRIFGLDAAALASYEAVLHRIHQDDRGMVTAKVRESGELNRDYDAEFRIRRPDGEIRWLAGMGRAVTYNGKPVEMSGVNFDITVRKESEELLRASEEHFRELVDALPFMVWIADGEGEVEYRNREWHRVVGLATSGSEVEVRKAVLHPDDFPVWARTWADAVRSAETYEMEYRFWDPVRGEYRWYLGQARKAKGAGNASRWYGGCTDIHERKLAEANLIASQVSLLEREDQFALLFDSGFMGDYTWDIPGDRVRCHPTILKLYGQELREEAAASAAEWLPASWFRDRQHPEEWPFIESEVTAMLEGERPLDVEFRVIWPDGSIHWLQCRANVTRFENGKPVLVSGINIDITERKTAALAIESSEEQFRALANSIPLMVWTSEPDGRIIYINRRWFETVGSDPNAPVDWQAAIHPEDLEGVISGLARSKQTGTPFETDVRLWNSKLGDYRWYSSRSVPLRDAGGRIVRWIGCSLETHDQKSAKDLLEAQVLLRTDELRHSLREKETLLKEVHHRVKNNLQIVSSLLKMQTDTVKDQIAQAALNESRQRVYSMALIHERLYGTDQMDEIDFADYAAGLVNELRYSIGRTSEIDIRIEAAKIFLNVEQAIPCGLILNELVTNALKYAYPAGDSGDILISLQEAPDRHVRLTVADRGVGLPAGFDLKSSDSLGLSIVDILARQIGGTLQFDAADGTAFIIDFPLADKPSPVRSSAA